MIIITSKREEKRKIKWREKGNKGSYLYHFHMFIVYKSSLLDLYSPYFPPPDLSFNLFVYRNRDRYTMKKRERTLYSWLNKIKARNKLPSYLFI
jgi:hypothetical protein